MKSAGKISWGSKNCLELFRFARMPIFNRRPVCDSEHAPPAPERVGGHTPICTRTRVAITKSRVASKHGGFGGANFHSHNAHHQRSLSADLQFMRLDTKRKAAYVRVNAARKSPSVYYMCGDALPSPRTVCSLSVHLAWLMRRKLMTGDGKNSLLFLLEKS